MPEEAPADSLLRMLRLLLSLLAGAVVLQAAPAWFKDKSPALETALVGKHGESQRPRIQRGITQVAELWRDSDGDAAAFADFVTGNFAPEGPVLDALFTRFQRRLEVIDGHLVELGYEFRLHTDLDRGETLPFDETFAGYALGAHVNDDLFGNKLAFVALLNFPLTTLDERLGAGTRWTRRQWAEARLASRFEQRVPASVLQEISKALSDADLYINQYNIWAHHLTTPDGGRPFAKGMKLITHWNLRDEIKGLYSKGRDGVVRQRMIRRVMERIIDQTIPASVINNPSVDWEPFSNQVAAAASKDSDSQPAPTGKPSAEREPDTRYANLLAIFRAQRAADPFSPKAPTHLKRRFDGDRQMSEARVVGMLEAVLSAPELRSVGALVQQRLGRPLEAFDIWYNGFRPRGAYSEEALDAMTRKRYPTPEAYRADIPNILATLGFRPERSAYLMSMIDVEPSRGPGHAMGGAMRGQHARLRTRVAADGMNYKGFNIAVHEMGHNIEQTFSQNNIDHSLLAGVPNTAFTEALAMLLQSHDMEVLGLAKPDAQARAAATIDLYWQTAEISGVALVDIGVWHWLYEHPEATPAELKAAVLSISKDVWNRFFAPVFGIRDQTLLAVYSHMIFDGLYLPDYPVGHLIQCQLEEHFAKVSSAGDEFERITSFGNLPPDLWMKNATGQEVGAEALLEQTRAALKVLKP